MTEFDKERNVTFLLGCWSITDGGDWTGLGWGTTSEEEFNDVLAFKGLGEDVWPE